MGVIPGRELREAWKAERVEPSFPKCERDRGRSHYSGVEAIYLDNEHQGGTTGEVGGAARLAVSVEEAAEMLGVSRGTAYNLVRTGDIPSLKLGRRIVVPLQRLLALVEGEART